MNTHSTQVNTANSKSNNWFGIGGNFADSDTVAEQAEMNPKALLAPGHFLKGTAVELDRLGREMELDEAFAPSHWGINE